MKCCLCDHVLSVELGNCPRCGVPVTPDPVVGEVGERTSVRRPANPPAASASVPQSLHAWPVSPAVGNPDQPSAQPWPPAPPPPQGHFLQPAAQPRLTTGPWDRERQTTIVLVLGIANGLFSVPHHLVMQTADFHGDFTTTWNVAGVLEASLGFSLAAAGAVAAVLKWSGEPLLAWLERPTTPAPPVPPPAGWPHRTGEQP